MCSNVPPWGNPFNVFISQPFITTIKDSYISINVVKNNASSLSNLPFIIYFNLFLFTESYAFFMSISKAF